MAKPKVCVSVIENNPHSIKVLEPLVDFFEVRIDLIGHEWTDLVKHINKPWIACCRSPQEGGKGSPDAVDRVEQLIDASLSGAYVVDIEYRTENLDKIVERIKENSRCLISYHDFEITPPYKELEKIVMGQIQAGADICKVVTTARSFEDNLTVLKLAHTFSRNDIVTFAMGEAGRLSRIMSPLCGGYFTFASAEIGKESAAGQVPVDELNKIYGYIRDE